MLINAKTPGRLRLLIVDVTQNHYGFEHALSREIYDAIRSCGVDMAVDSVLFPATDHEYMDIFARKDLHFTALLLVAHGCPDPGDGNATEVQTPGSFQNWYVLAGMTDNMRDKLLSLCVCHGFNPDMVSAWVNDDLFALTAIGPDDTLYATEARAFFSAFFCDLNRSSTESIDPNDVRQAVRTHGHLAGGKMCIYSDLLSHE